MLGVKIGFGSTTIDVWEFFVLSKSRHGLHPLCVQCALLCTPVNHFSPFPPLKFLRFSRYFTSMNGCSSFQSQKCLRPMTYHNVAFHFMHKTHQTERKAKQRQHKTIHSNSSVRIHFYYFIFPFFVCECVVFCAHSLKLWHRNSNLHGITLNKWRYFFRVWIEFFHCHTKIISFWNILFALQKKL